MKPAAEILRFIDGEITGLKARIGSAGNAVQREKLEMLMAIRAFIAERRNAGAA